jgi:hypothetical protein
MSRFNSVDSFFFTICFIQLTPNPVIFDKQGVALSVILSTAKDLKVVYKVAILKRGSAFFLGSPPGPAQILRCAQDDKAKPNPCSK